MKSLLSTLLFTLLAGVVAAQNLSVDITFVSPTCHGFTNGTATANVSGGTGPYAYAWSNNQSGQTNLGLAAGQYSVTVTDQTNATTSAIVNLPEPAPIGLEVSQNAANCTAFAPITASTSGGVAPLSFQWSTGGSTASITPTSPGNVFVTVTDANGCAEATTYYVPVPSQIFTAYNTLAPSCAGGTNGSVVPNIVGNYLPHTWVWSTGTNASQSLSGVPSGNYSITITDAQGCTKVDEVFVPTQAPVQTALQLTNVLCHGTASGVAKALTAGGVSPFTFVWENGSTDPIRQNLVAGTYTVTATDANGCSATATGTITQPDPLQTTVVSVTPSCGNTGSITVQPSGGTPPYNLVWNGGQYTGTTVNNLPPGNYYICTFDANNCQLDINVVVPGGPGLTVQIVTEKATCPGVNDGQATAIVTGGSGNYTYAWSNGAPPVAALNNLPAGTTLTVTVTDVTTGCNGTATATIGTHGQITVQVSDTDVFCSSNTTGSATATAISGTAPFTFVWDVNGTLVNGPEITGLTAGAYAVTMTDAQGCTSVGVADIGATATAVAAFTLQTLDCPSDSVLVQLVDQSTSTGGAITSWSWVVAWGTGSIAFTGQNPPPFEVPYGATVSAQLTVSTAAGCTTTVSDEVEMPTQLSLSIDVISPGNGCSGEPSQITVLGSPTYTYTWLDTTGLTFVNGNPQTVIASPTATTIYNLVVNNGGCTDSVAVEIVKAVPLAVTLNNEVIQSCDTTVALSATFNVPLTGVTIKWVNAAGDSLGNAPTLTVQGSTGTNAYTVLVTDANGCTATATATVFGHAVDVQGSIVAETLICANTPVQANVVGTDPTDILIYQWSANSPNVVFSNPIAPNPTITAPSGAYIVSVTVTNQYGCSRVLSTPVTFEVSGNINGQIAQDLCNGLTVAFENTGTTPGVWSFGDNTTSTLNDPSHTYAAAGTYVVTFTPDADCILPYTDTIQVQATPAVVAGIVSSLEDCLNVATFGFDDATQHNDPLATWLWTFSTGQTSNEQNPTVTFLNPGPVTATLVVTDVNGCVDTSAVATVQVDIVTDTLASALKICEGGQVALNPNANPAYTYNWTATPVDPNLQAGDSNPVVSPLVPTTYSVNIQNGTCNVQQSVAVAVNPLANITASPDTALCTMKAVTVSATTTNGIGFQWSQSAAFTTIFATTPSVEVMPAGMNYVRTSTLMGCPGVDSVDVKLAAVDVEPFPVEGILCNETTASLSVTNNNPGDTLTYTWSNNLPPIPNPTATVTENTVFTVQVENQFGCRDTLSFNIQVVNINLALDITGKDTICAGEEAQLTVTPTGGVGGYMFEWSPAATIDNPNSQSPIASPIETTQYSVVVMDEASGCTVTGVVDLEVMQTECGEPYLFVPNAFTPNGDNNNDFFRVRGINIKEIYFVVWDRWGEKVYETEDPLHTGWDGVFKDVVSSPDSYAWFTRVTCGNGAVWEKRGNVTLLR